MPNSFDAANLEDLSALRTAALEPDKTALLVVDMQNMECRPGPDSQTAQPDKQAFYSRLRDTVIPNQVRLLAAARAKGLEVVFTTIESLTLDGRDRSLDYKVSNLHAAKGSYDAQVVEELEYGENEIHIPKTSSSVFNSTNINYVLKNLGVEYLIIFGIVTEQCVESAIRDAADLGYLVTMVDDCCASYDEARHADCVTRMDGHYCRVRSTRAVISEIRGENVAHADGPQRAT